ncbi:MAG: nucleotide exchange factor GrpE [Verrucomicrobia bacterium]|nr:nucleotide exchange factor GrpE [Verrucomicrobiota bacterium]
MTENQAPIDSPEPKKPMTAEEELKEYKEKYLRLLADVDNTRKRMQKEKQEMTRFAIDNVISEILGPIDNLENALQFTQHMSDEMRNWAQGFLMILGQFKDVLSNHGVTAFHSEGNRFDPQLHYAIESEETADKPEGTILKEYVKGYRSGERTVRPARVKVAVAPETKKKEGQTQSETHQEPSAPATE